jgi:hypothetical protein
MRFGNLHAHLSFVAAALLALPVVAPTNHRSDFMVPASAAPNFTIHILGAECVGLRYATCITNDDCDLSAHCWIAGLTQVDPVACTEFPCKPGAACEIPAGCNSVYVDPGPCIAR